MKQRLFILLAGITAAAALAFTAGLLPSFGMGKASAKSLQWVNANQLRVHVNGRWQDVPMVPLADHLCETRHPMYMRYCDDAPSIQP